MSKKYVPSFLKTESNQMSFSTVTSSNKFEALSDDFDNNKVKPLVNTSLPAKEAPKLMPATLASLTSNGNSGNMNSGKGTFAANFAKQAKLTSEPDSKLLDVTSENDFPSLGGPAKSVKGIWGTKSFSKDQTILPTENTLSFADKAKDWAKKKEEEAEEARRKAIEEEKKHNEAELHKRIAVFNLKRNQRNITGEDEDDEYNNDQSSLGEDDNYEVPEYDEEPSEEEFDEENDEFNQNTGWDGRHKDDLY
jgi:hypothetical protein